MLLCCCWARLWTGDLPAFLWALCSWKGKWPGTSMREVGQKIQIPTHLTLLSDATALIGSDTIQLLSQVRLAGKWGEKLKGSKSLHYLMANNPLMKQIFKCLKLKILDTMNIYFAAADTAKVSKSPGRFYTPATFTLYQILIFIFKEVKD